MNSMLFAYLFSAGAVILAEMGDKTQLLAMAFATKYKASKVMLGVFIATIAFFLAEMGDKTQLATIALSAKFPASPVGILMGTTTGMLIADAVGIIFGIILCKRIPERKIKLVSAGAFILFGLIGTYQTAHEQLHLSPPAIAAILIGLTALTSIAAYFIIKSDRKSSLSPITGSHCNVK